MSDMTDEQALAMFGAAAHMASQDSTVASLKKRIVVLEHALKLITDPCNGAMVKEDLAWKALRDKT